MKKKILVGLLVLVFILGITFTLKALTNENRLRYINWMRRTEQLSYGIAEILSVPDTLRLDVIGTNIKVPLSDSLITLRNQAARNRFILLKTIVDSLAVELNVP